MNTKKRFFTTYDLSLSALFIALIAVGAFIKIPIGTVPITLQFMFVLLAGQLLKPLCAFLTLIIYTVMGLIGLPVFSSGGGVGYVLNPTFGYIIGFIFAAVVVSLLMQRGKRSLWHILFSNFFGFITVYVFGVIYYFLLSKFYFGAVVDLGALLLTGFVVFIPTDILFCVLTAIISKRLSPFFITKKHNSSV